MCYTESHHLAGRLLCRTGEFKAAKTRRSGPGSGGLVNPDGRSRAQVCQNRLSVLRATAQREKKLGATQSSKPAKSVGQYRRGHSRRVIRGKYPQLVQQQHKGQGLCVWLVGWVGVILKTQNVVSGKVGQDGAAGPTRKVASSHNSSRTSLGLQHGAIDVSAGREEMCMSVY